MTILSACFAACLLTAASECRKPGKFINNYAGPFEINFLDFGACTDKSQRGSDGYIPHFLVTSNGTIRNLRYLSGNFTTNFTMDEDVGCHVSMASWDSVSGWRPNAFRMTFPSVVKALRDHIPTVYAEAIAAIGDGTGPPIKPGTYKMDVACNTHRKIIGFPAMVYGRYRVTMPLYQRQRPKTIIGCVEMILSTDPLST